MSQPICELKTCEKPLGPGSAKVGYDRGDGKIDEVKCCKDCTWLVMTSPRGTWNITPDRELKAVPATPKIII